MRLVWYLLTLLDGKAAYGKAGIMVRAQNEKWKSCSYRVDMATIEAGHSQQ